MSDVIKVAVIGAAGRMGATVCRAVTDAPDLDLVGRFDVGDDLGDLGGADVVVEFSVPTASLANVQHCVARGVHVVVGTTGWSEDKLSVLRDSVAAQPGTGVLIAPNFAIGAILMMSFAQQAARFYESVEVIELHHPNKVDAPSGTAARTADLIGAAREEAGLGPVPDATTQDPGGARGGRGTAYRCIRCGCADSWRTRRCSSVRWGDAHHPPRQFRPVVLHARRACWCARGGRPPGVTVGLEHYLGLA